MADMTLVEAPDALRGLAKVIREHGTCAPMAVEHVADAIDAHLAGMGEPAAEVYAGAFGIHYIGCADPNKLPVGTKLYTAPPASGDWDAVRREVADMRNTREVWGSDVDGWADKLTAALPESQP